MICVMSFDKIWEEEPIYGCDLLNYQRLLPYDDVNAHHMIIIIVMHYTIYLYIIHAGFCY